jgi:hypothetical protein
MFQLPNFNLRSAPWLCFAKASPAVEKEAYPMGTLPDSRKRNKRLFHQIHSSMSTVEGTIPLLGLLQMIELCIYMPTPIPLRLLFSSQPFSHALAEKISNWPDLPISPQSKHGMENFRLSMVRAKRTPCSDARAYAAHDRDDIKAALLPSLEAETWPPITSLSQRVSIFIFYSLRVSCSKPLVATGKRKEICLYLALCELSSFT